MEGAFLIVRSSASQRLANEAGQENCQHCEHEAIVFQDRSHAFAELKSEAAVGRCWNGFASNIVPVSIVIVRPFIRRFRTGPSG